jgi:Na+(H+)/acetate symporter ActP
VLFIAIVLGFANVAFYFHEDGMKAVNWIALVVSVVILLVLYRLLHRSAPKHN